MSDPMIANSPQQPRPSASSVQAAPSVGVLVFFFLVAAVLIGGFEYVLQARSASLLLSLVYFTMLTQGCLAVVAAAETALGRWIRPFKGALLAVAPMLFLLPVLFVFMYYKWPMYPKSAAPNFWHDREFFILRNVGVLLITALVGNGFSAASRAGRPSASTWAIFYLLAWVISMSFVAFDWVMPLEWPWVSTLFGAYFFVESFFMGLCMAAIVLYALSRRLPPGEWEAIRWPRQAAAFMLFGFSVVWGHEFFSQYLVIWYGNLPEYNSFFVYRLEVFGQWIYVVPLLLFALPFVLLLPAAVKWNAGHVMTAALIVLAGLVVERVMILRPVAPLFSTTAGTGMALFEFSLLGSLVGWMISRRLPPPHDHLSAPAAV